VLLAPPNLAPGGVIVLGAILQFENLYAAYHDGMRRAMELALNEINSASGGGVLVGETRRSLVGVVCNEGAKDPFQGALEGARHLTLTAGSPVLMGPSLPEHLVAVFNNVVGPANKLQLAIPEGGGVNVGVQLASTPAGKKAPWSCMDSDASKIKPTLGALRHLEEVLRKERGKEKIKVVLVVEDSENGRSFAEALEESAGEAPVLNGLSFKENLAPEHRHIVEVKMPHTSKPQGFESLTLYTEQVFAEAPDLVLYGPANIKFYAGIPELEGRYEAAFPDAPEALTRPRYLVVTYDDAAWLAAEKRPGLVHRVRFLQRPSVLGEHRAFAARYRESFSKDPPSVAAHQYECTYLSSYLLLAALRSSGRAPESLTHEDLTQGLQRLQSGETALQAIGPGKAAANALEALSGTDDPLRFTGLHGEILMDERGFPRYPAVELQCISLDPEWEGRYLRPSGLTFSVDQGLPQGQDGCP
jgi:hypothetical protein